MESKIHKQTNTIQYKFSIITDVILRDKLKCLSGFKLFDSYLSSFWLYFILCILGIPLVINVWHLVVIWNDIFFSWFSTRHWTGRRVISLILSTFSYEDLCNSGSRYRYNLIEFLMTDSLSQGQYKMRRQFKIGFLLDVNWFIHHWIITIQNIYNKMTVIIIGFTHNKFSDQDKENNFTRPKHHLGIETIFFNVMVLYSIKIHLWNMLQ